MKNERAKVEWERELQRMRIQNRKEKQLWLYTRGCGFLSCVLLFKKDPVRSVEREGERFGN